MARLIILVLLGPFNIGATHAETDNTLDSGEWNPVDIQPKSDKSAGSDSSKTSPGRRVELPERDPNACRSDPTREPEMVVIEGGHFWMGSLEGESDEKPVHEVAVKTFALGRCEVTVAEFAFFVEATGYVATADNGDCRALNEAGTTFADNMNASWRDPGYLDLTQVGAMPVVCVSFDDTLAYTEWLTLQLGRSYRLPTEAEWEYAARGRTTTARFWEINQSASQCKFANGADQDAKTRFEQRSNVDCADGHVISAPVATYRPNPYGLYDMLGNVWEWTTDCWRGPYDDPIAIENRSQGDDCLQRVVRGGSWFYGPDGLRSANRSKDYPMRTYNSVGFRVARTL